MTVTAKFAIQFVAPETAKPAARNRLGNISPRSTHMGRSHFRDIHRGQHARRANGQSRHDSRADKHAHGTGCSRSERTAQEQHRVNNHRWASANAVGQRSRAESTKGAPNQHGCDGETGGGGVGAEGRRESGHRPIDHTTIKTKEQAADCRHAGQADDIEVIGLGVALRGRGCRGLRDTGLAWLGCACWQRFLHGNNSFVSIGLEIDAELAAEDDGVGELSRAARSHHILNIRLEKECAFAQIETIGPLQNRFMALHTAS